MPFLSEFHCKTFQKYIRFFSKQTFTRYDKWSKVPSLLKAVIQILLFLCVVGTFYNAGRFTSQVRSLINITDANIYDAISVSFPKTSYKKISSITIEFTLHSCLRFSEHVAIILPSIVATWVYVRFVANIGGLESSAS